MITWKKCQYLFFKNYIYCSTYQISVFITLYYKKNNFIIYYGCESIEFSNNYVYAKLTYLWNICKQQILKIKSTVHNALDIEISMEKNANLSWFKVLFNSQNICKESSPWKLSGHNHFVVLVILQKNKASKL